MESWCCSDRTRPGHVTLKFYDVLGREIVSLVDGVVDAGRHGVVWDAGVAGGVYVYRMITGENVAAKKLVMLK